jgi:hypothetical protein
MTSSLGDTCKNMREIRTPRSRFLLCELSITNAAYPRYPPQPLVRSESYKPRNEPKQDWQGDQPGQHV